MARSLIDTMIGRLLIMVSVSTGWESENQPVYFGIVTERTEHGAVCAVVILWFLFVVGWQGP